MSHPRNEPKTVKIRAMVAILALASPLLAQDDLELSAEEFPRVPATEPVDALGTFETAEGFRLVLAAHEPDVVDPIAMVFDERGRAWVIEMRGYSERREESLGRIRILEDTDGDGRFDQSTVFRDGLKWPTALLPYQDGAFVGATPDVTFFRDTDGDGVADEEKVVFTGFGGGNLKLNMQALFNSFRWGPDNRIWGATAANGGTVSKPDDPSFEPLALRGSDFSFDPEKLDLRAENGTAQYGMSFDSQGRRFVCSNSRHLVWVAYERGHVNPNPWFSLPPALVDIPDDGAAAPVHRISPDEPWRIVRTRWRIAGVVKGVVEGGGRVSGYFTSATGVHLYWGDAFGDEFRDNAFIGDVGSNLVHRKVIRTKEDAVALVASRPDPEEKAEFLRSRDNWFRPTSFATGPDGCLYVTDMYRETIEHPWSLPEPIKKHLDLNSGWDRGRIYRIEPVDFERREVPDLSKASDEELAALTSHPNDWHRTTARRLLYQRGKPVDPIPPAKPFPSLLASGEALLDHFDEASRDPWMEAAFFNSLRTPEAVEAAWAKFRTLKPNSFYIRFLTFAGKSGNNRVLESIITELDSSPPENETADQIEALRDGMGTKAFAVTKWPRLGPAAEQALDSDSSPASRQGAIRILDVLGGYDGALQSALDSETDPVVLTALVSAIDDLTFLVGRFPGLPEEGKPALANRIGGNAAASLAFLDGIEKREIDLATAPASLIDTLRNHRDERVKDRAAEVLPPVVSRADVIAKFEPVLSQSGDPEKGKFAFAKACLSCHVSHEGEGIELGPSIATFAAAGKDSMLGNILDPNREVAPQYQAYVIEKSDGATLVGIIRAETPEEVTIRMPGGIDQTFPRTEVVSMKGLGQSLMPEGLEASLTVEEMADLLTYLAAPPQR